jgi:hypothetical protein
MKGERSIPHPGISTPGSGSTPKNSPFPLAVSTRIHERRPFEIRFVPIRQNQRVNEVLAHPALRRRRRERVRFNDGKTTTSEATTNRIDDVVMR